MFPLHQPVLFQKIKITSSILIVGSIKTSRRFLSFLNSSGLIQGIDSNNLVFGKIKKQAKENSIRALILLDKSIQISSKLEKRITMTSLGWLLGFRKENYSGSFEHISPCFYDFNIVKYMFF